MTFCIFMAPLLLRQIHADSLSHSSKHAGHSALSLPTAWLAIANIASGPSKRRDFRVGDLRLQEVKPYQQAALLLKELVEHRPQAH
jgi:hypothetical protein